MTTPDDFPQPDSAPALPQDDNPMKNAPHTAASLLKAEWPHAYSRELAAYPVASLRKQ